MAKHYILDHGYVDYMSHTPEGDKLVVNAARCSFDKEHKVFDEEKDTRLINYLAREKHLLPFRHPNVTLRLHMPIFVARQLGKHQVGFSWSEVSRRYITGEPDFFTPGYYRQKADNVKQGSDLEAHWNDTMWKADTIAHNKKSLQLYNDMIAQGVCAEQARAVLPQNMYTTCVTTGTLLGWHHLYTQRTDSHTQLETQAFAYAIGNILETLYPVSWNALTKHS